MDSIIIEQIGPNDLQKLQHIGKQTFFETFSSSNTEENMKNYLEEGFSVDKLSNELANPNSQFYFAIQGENVIGYLKLNYGASQTELKDEAALEIERIYVLKDFHGKSVGQLLYNKAMEVAKRKKVDYVWLGVWEENPRAISFYKKNGFVEFDRHIFKLGDDEQTDIMMKLELNNENCYWKSSSGYINSRLYPVERISFYIRKQKNRPKIFLGEAFLIFVSTQYHNELNK